MPLALAAVYLIWGSTFYAMRVAAEGIPPFLMGGSRFVVAGSLLLLFLRLRGEKLLPLRAWPRIAPVGALLFVGGNGLLAFAESRGVPSGTAAVMNATIPLFMAVLGAASARPSGVEWTGIGLGFAGVLLLAGGPDLWGAGPLVVAASLGSPLTWSIGSLIARRSGASGLATAAVQMLLGGLSGLLVGALFGERIEAVPATSALLAWSHLVLFGSLLGFSAYSWLLHHARPAVATSYAYVNPVLAVALGAVAGGETLGWRLVVAMPLVVASVALVIGSRTRGPFSVRASHPTR